MRNASGPPPTPGGGRTAPPWRTSPGSRSLADAADSPRSRADLVLAAYAGVGLDNLPRRILDRLDRTPSGCWLWSGPRNRDGYGVVSVGGRVRLGGATVRVHRLAFTAAYGMPPVGSVLDHVRVGTGLPCSRACAEPTHLSAVTNRVNVTRPGSANWAADQTTRTTCPRGHRLDCDNLRPDLARRGQRTCRACNNARTAVWNADRQGHAYADPATAVLVLADLYAAHFLDGGPRPAHTSSGVLPVRVAS